MIRDGIGMGGSRRRRNRMDGMEGPAPYNEEQSHLKKKGELNGWFFFFFFFFWGGVA